MMYPTGLAIFQSHTNNNNRMRYLSKTSLSFVKNSFTTTLLNAAWRASDVLSGALIDKLCRSMNNLSQSFPIYTDKHGLKAC